jgi:hypothetical protein
MGRGLNAPSACRGGRSRNQRLVRRFETHGAKGAPADQTLENAECPGEIAKGEDDPDGHAGLAGPEEDGQGDGGKYEDKSINGAKAAAFTVDVACKCHGQMIKV